MELFCRSYECGFDSVKKIWGRRIDSGYVGDIVINILVIVETLSRDAVAERGGRVSRNEC